MCTVIIVTQWPVLLERCDQVFELKDGDLHPIESMPERGKAVV